MEPLRRGAALYCLSGVDGLDAAGARIQTLRIASPTRRPRRPRPDRVHSAWPGESALSRKADCTRVGPAIAIRRPGRTGVAGERVARVTGALNAGSGWTSPLSVAIRKYAHNPSAAWIAETWTESPSITLGAPVPTLPTLN